MQNMTTMVVEREIQSGAVSVAAEEEVYGGGGSHARNGVARPAQA